MDRKYFGIIAREVGDLGAMIVEDLLRLILPAGRGKERNRWVARTREQWCEEYPWKSEATVRRTLAKLEKRGYLLVEHGRPNRYALGFDALPTLESVDQNDPMSAHERALDQNDPRQNDPIVGQNDPDQIDRLPSHTCVDEEYSKYSSTSRDEDAKDDDVQDASLNSSESIPSPIGIRSVVEENEKEMLKYPEGVEGRELERESEGETERGEPGEMEKFGPADGKKPDPTPPPDHEDWKRSREMSNQATEKLVETRKKKAKGPTAEDVRAVHALGTPGGDVSAVAKKGKKKGRKFYSWEHYDWAPEVWEGIKRGEYPENERPSTILIGAFLIGLHVLDDTTNVLVEAKEFNGKLGTTARNCFEYFTAQQNGDELEGMRAALDYIKWFLKTDNGFIVEKGRTINICFSIWAYRDAYQEFRLGKDVKADRARGALAVGDFRYVKSEEERMQIKGIRM